MNSKINLWTLCLSCLLMMMFLATQISLSYAAQKQVTIKVIPVGRVVWVTGVFKAALPDQKQRTLQRSSLIFLHDTLITDNQSQAEVIFTDNSLVSFRPNSSFRVDNYKFNPTQHESKSVRFVGTLIKGGFRTITGWVGKSNPDSYQINTPLGTMGVRGTEFSIYYDPYKGLYTHLSVGKLFLKNKAGRQDLDVDTGEVYSLISGLNIMPQLLTSAPSVFDNDANIIPAQIDPTPPVPGVKFKTNINIYIFPPVMTEGYDAKLPFEPPARKAGTVGPNCTLIFH